MLSHAQLLHALECQASAETAVRHQPKLGKASAEHVLSCLSRIRTKRVCFFSSRRRHTSWTGDWSSDVCSSDLAAPWQDQRQQVWSGRLSDSMCGASHQMRAAAGKMSERECIFECIKALAKYVLV